MERFAMYGKVVAKPGRRDALVEILLEAARLLTPVAGCQLYIVNVVPAEPGAIWATELWTSEADHDASLKMEHYGSDRQGETAGRGLRKRSPGSGGRQGFVSAVTPRCASGAG